MNTVICYYPGSGGHRYKNFLTDREYTTPSKIYDNNQKDIYNIRYITNDTKVVNCDKTILLTHCMNSSLINEKIPNSRIIKIVANLQLSLARGWGMFFKDLKQFDSDLDNAFTTIKWHHEYYKQYPADIIADELVLVDIDSTTFCQTMRSELTDYSNQTFNQAWEIYSKFGPQAPVLDIERNEQK